MHKYIQKSSSNLSWILNICIDECMYHHLSVRESSFMQMLHLEEATRRLRKYQAF